MNKQRIKVTDIPDLLMVAGQRGMVMIYMVKFLVKPIKKRCHCKINVAIAKIHSRAYQNRLSLFLQDLFYRRSFAIG